MWKLSVFIEAHLIPLLLYLNQRPMIFHRADRVSIIIVIELANLRVKICAVLSLIHGTIDCCSALLTDLIEGILRHWNVAHESVRNSL